MYSKEIQRQTNINIVLFIGLLVIIAVIWYDISTHNCREGIMNGQKIEVCSE